jgi:hypothetical protein
MQTPFYPSPLAYSSGGFAHQPPPYMQAPPSYPHVPSPLGVDAAGSLLRRQLSTPLPAPGQLAPMLASPMPSHMAATSMSPQHAGPIRMSHSVELGDAAGLKLLQHQQQQQALLQQQQQRAAARFAGKSRKNAEPKIGPDGNPRLNARCAPGQRRQLVLLARRRCVLPLAVARPRLSPPPP